MCQMNVVKLIDLCNVVAGGQRAMAAQNRKLTTPNATSRRWLSTTCERLTATLMAC